MMILTVSGWRHWVDAGFVINKLADYVKMHGQMHIRVGCAPGVDAYVRHWVPSQSICPLTMTVYYADWDNLGKAAGHIRNDQMLRGESVGRDPFPNVLADKLLAFPQPGVKMRSPGSGTVGCILDAHLLGIDVDIPGYRVEER